MKTAQELASILETGSGLVRSQLLEAAAMLIQQAEQIDALTKERDGAYVQSLQFSEENKAFKADAERYRHLRATTNWVSNSKGQRIDVRKSPELWDAAIDAMKGTQS